MAPCYQPDQSWGGDGTSDEWREQCLRQREQEVQRTMDIHGCGCLWPERGRSVEVLARPSQRGYIRNLDLIPKKKKKVENFQLGNDLILYQFKVMALAAAGRVLAHAS